MLIKVIRGRDPKALCRYVLDPKKQKIQTRNAIEETGIVSSIIFCRTIPGRTTEQLANNIQLLAKLNSRVQKIVAHYSISLHPNEGRQVERSQMKAISREVLDRLGHSRCPYFGVEHHDARQKHWHLVSSTIRYDGKWVDDSFDRYRIRSIEREIEQEFHLTHPFTEQKITNKNLTTGEYRRKARTNEVLPKEKIWNAIDDCIEPEMSLALLILTLRARYPEISIRMREKGKEKVGISFGIDEIAFAGRSLGRTYSLNGLIKHHGVKYTSTISEQVDQVLALSSAECRNLLSRVNEQVERPSSESPSRNLEITR